MSVTLRENLVFYTLPFRNSISCFIYLLAPTFFLFLITLYYLGITQYPFNLWLNRILPKVFLIFPSAHFNIFMPETT